MNIVESIVDSVPERVRSRLRGTPVESAVINLRAGELELTQVTARTPAGRFELAAPGNSVLVDILERGGSYEPVLTEALARRADRETVFYDVGSRFGYYTRLLETCGVPTDRIHAFEADAVAAHVLSMNHRSGVNRNRTRVGAGGETLTLDGYAATNQSPTLVKVDVEGAEYDVLRGMARTLADATPELFVEIHPHKLPEFGAVPERIYDLLWELGYSVRVDPDHRSPPSDWSAVDERQLPTDETYLLRARPD